jgi:hypothetical protein
MSSSSCIDKHELSKVCSVGWAIVPDPEDLRLQYDLKSATASADTIRREEAACKELERCE